MMTVSVSMIVKNEEQVLARCLDCLKDFADEIVIVDTGSEDSTREIARKYTDRVYDFEWKDDFSAARNYAFGLCSMDYIYSADADEVIDKVNINKIISLKSSLDPSVEIVQFVYVNQLEFNTTYNFDKEPRPKLYKRCRSFTFEGRVHEAVRMDPLVFDSDIEVIHKPMSLHSGRDFSIFLKSIAMDGGLSKRLRSMYLRELAVSGEDGDFTAAFDYFKEAVEEETDEDLVKSELFVLMRAARVRNDRDLFMKYSHRALAVGACSETAFELGEFYRTSGDEREAAIWYFNAKNETEPLLNIKYGGEYPEKYLL